MKDKELINELKNGNANAFKVLVEEYQNKVINICFGFVHNREDAEDITQEVFIEVYNSISHFRGDSKLSTWLYRISVNKSLDFIRRKNRKKRFARFQNLLGFERTIEEVQESKLSNPHTILENKETIQILNETVETLPQNQKIAFTLSKYEGFKNKEIAEVMKTSLSSVESLMHRAKKNLKEKLYDYYKNIYL